MDCKSGTELRLEPCCLRRHDVARIGDVYKLLHGNRIEGESHFHLSVVHSARKFSKTADSADEINSLVSAEILDAENLVKYEI